MLSIDFALAATFPETAPRALSFLERGYDVHGLYYNLVDHVVTAAEQRDR